MQYLNIAQIYSGYSTVFDFFIFLAMFMGLAQIAFGKKFEGNGAKALIVGIGVALSVGLSATEAKFGFSLASFGSLAVIILMACFGALFFYLMVSMGVHKTTALAWAFILGFLFLQSLSSKLSQWVQDKFPLMNLLFLAALVFGVIKVLMFFGSGSKLKNTAKGLLNKVPEYVKSIPLQEERQERKSLKDEARTINQERKVSASMIGMLQEIRGMIQQYGDTEKGRKAVAKQIQSLSSQEGKLMQKLGHLMELDKRLGELDIVAVRRLKDEFGKVPAEERSRIAREIEAEKDKYKLGERMGTLDYDIKRLVASFNAYMKYCVEYLGKNLIDKALQSLDAAIRLQMSIDKLFEEMERIGVMLTGLTKREYKAMKKEKKAA